MNRPCHIARRRFLKTLAAAGFAAPWVTRDLLAAPPGARLNVALIGSGGRGSHVALEVLRLGHHLVALCDVDQSQLAAARKFLAEKYEGGTAAMEKAASYDDYRKLLDAGKTFDAAIVATGSRWHAPICVALMKAGKHVYCEKPLVHKLAEARELIELVPKCKVATQTGTQGGSSKAFRRAVEILQAGLIGPVRRIYLWCDGYGPNPPSHDRPPGEDPVPAGLNWDFWLGPAPLRPFKRNVYHPGCLRFQNWFDLCNGMLAGQGAHTFNLPVRALRLGPPVRVEAEIREPIKETYPQFGKFRFEYPARGDLPPVTLWWSDGGAYPPPEITANLKSVSGKVPNMGCLFLGERGELYAGGWGGEGLLRLAGDKQWRGVLDHEAAKALPVTLPRIEGDNHVLEWLRACQGGPATWSDFITGARVSEAYLPGILALRLGRPIDWDGAAMRARGVPEAEPLIQKTYRKKWIV
ncbi:MAG: Gfo/Idh/MocA family oxidoreductase [Thermoguttaceae bacterium]|jgi:hypothetical protein|nr:Gfo/Idh/MocA family oxidoreductase [Thermoguttaceae bacterium]